MKRAHLLLVTAAVSIACLAGCNDSTQAKPVSFYVGDSAARNAMGKHCVEDVKLMTTDGDCLNAIAAEGQVRAKADRDREIAGEAQFRTEVEARRVELQHRLDAMKR